MKSFDIEDIADKYGWFAGEVFDNSVELEHFIHETGLYIKNTWVDSGLTLFEVRLTSELEGDHDKYSEIIVLMEAKDEADTSKKATEQEPS